MDKKTAIAKQQVTVIGPSGERQVLKCPSLCLNLPEFKLANSFSIILDDENLPEPLFTIPTIYYKDRADKGD